MNPSRPLRAAASLGIVSEFRHAMRNFLLSNHISSEEQSSAAYVQAIRDTKLSILSCTKQQIVCNRKTTTTKTTTTSHAENQEKTAGNQDVLEKDELLELAVCELEEAGLDACNLDELRDELQKRLSPQVARIVNSFGRAESRLARGGSGVGAGGVLAQQNTRNLEKTLTAARNVVSKDLNNLEEANVGSSKNQGFLERKIESLQHALQEKEEEDSTFTKTEQSIEWQQQQRQLVHLAKSSILKEQLGYTLLTLPSTIQSHNDHTNTMEKGLYVDGYAPEGSIVGFFPGQVWPKEHLLHGRHAAHFAHDENYQLSMRYDEVLIDARGLASPPPPRKVDGKRIPSFVEEEGEDEKDGSFVPLPTAKAQEARVVSGGYGTNPWAMAHMANHPPHNIGDKALNCRAVAIDFHPNLITQDNNVQGDDMDLDLEELEIFLARFIPNTYAKKPLLLGPKMFQGNTVWMHGLALLATRDVADEELFYNYGLNPRNREDHPSWYRGCEVDATLSRWAL